MILIGIQWDILGYTVGQANMFAGKRSRFSLVFPWHDGIEVCTSDVSELFPDDISRMPFRHQMKN